MVSMDRARAQHRRPASREAEGALPEPSPEPVPAGSVPSAWARGVITRTVATDEDRVVTAALRETAAARALGRMYEPPDETATPTVGEKEEKREFEDDEDEYGGEAEKSPAQQPTPEAQILEARQAIEGNGGNLGAEKGSGGFGTIHLVPGRTDLAVKIATGTGGAKNAQLQKEGASLQMLAEGGLPTAFIGTVTWTNAQMQPCEGLLMRFVTGSFSKKMLKMGKFARAEPTPEELSAINEKTVTDLLELKKKCILGMIDIEDLQFMISAADGSIVLIDPARATKFVPKLDGPKKERVTMGDIKLFMKQFEKRIDRIIRAVEEIASANAKNKK
jgi:hypothetical protein